MKNAIEFLQSSSQVGMKNVVKYWIDFMLYLTALETYCELQIQNGLGKDGHQ